MLLTSKYRYHDHAVDITALNVGFGQAGKLESHSQKLAATAPKNNPGFYILHDPDPSQNFGLPTGDYDIPLMVVSKQFNEDGTLFDFAEPTPGDAFGDVITVNGVPWPFLEVEPRKYRFRLVDASVTRSYLLHLVSTYLGTSFLWSKSRRI